MKRSLGALLRIQVLKNMETFASVTKLERKKGIQTQNKTFWTRFIKLKLAHQRDWCLEIAAKVRSSQRYSVYGLCLLNTDHHRGSRLKYRVENVLSFKTLCQYEEKLELSKNWDTLLHCKNKHWNRSWKIWKTAQRDVLNKHLEPRTITVVQTKPVTLKPEIGQLHTEKLRAISQSSA